MERVKTSTPPIAVSMGDPAGVGPRLVAEAWRQSKNRKIPPFIFFGPLEVFIDHGIDIPLSDDFSRGVPVFKIPVAGKIVPGIPNRQAAGAVVKSIEAAVRAVAKGQASAVVTCPIHKKTLLEGGFKHAGHTEFLGRLAGARPVMMLASDNLKVVPVTVHLPLKEAVKKLSKKLIVETGKIVASDLEKRFRISNPRIAVTGLNPHAGEGGALGGEEKQIIIPAIAELQAAGINAVGPFPADTAFTPAMRMKYDAYLAMTHDQALIPVKTLDFRSTVNITLGLPFVRTSPAHGTAFDLIRAGGTPDAESFIQALIMAARLSS